TVILTLAGAFLWITLRDHYQDVARAHTIDVMRLSSLVENDIAALETGHRGFLLTGKPDYLAAFERRKASIEKDIQDLTRQLGESEKQQKPVLKAQEIVQKWINTTALPEIESRKKFEANAIGQSESLRLGKSELDRAHEILQSLQDEEQILFNTRMRQHEWAAQSTEVLNFLPKLERTVVEMQKEKRGYLLTGENRFEAAYDGAVTDFYTYNGYLAVLLASAPAQAELLANVRADVGRWVDTIGGPEMRAKEEGNDVAALALSDNGEKVIGQIRQMIGSLEENELNAYQTRAALTRHQRFVRTSAIACLAFFAVALLVASNSYSFVLVRQQLSKLAKSQRELGAVEIRIRSIIQNILDGMITLDENGVIRSMNPAAEKMFGYSEKEMVGYKLSKLVPKWYANEPEAKAAAMSWSEMVKRTGSTALALARTRQLVSFPAEISLSEMAVDEKKFYVAMVRDVTEQKRFERELAAEKESLAVTVRSIGDGVITTDVRGRIIMMNNEAERLTGWPSKEAIGKPLKTVFNFVVDLATQARTAQTGFRNEAQSILLSLPENATLVARDGSER
ncbi:MAG: CHASE3 domain-containing protein, partial [Chthoniobacterales bacterium]